MVNTYFETSKRRCVSYKMGKPLSRPGCLRQSPCCSKKNEREGYNEDGYIPQRSIYDTMCINEHIDHGSAHSTLGSRRGRETDFSSNGSLGGDMFDTRSSVLLTSGRKLDERFIFDSLKLANDELRTPGGFVRSTSPSVSCSSAPGGSMNKRHPLQESGKKDNLCRHSWKVLTPPKFPDPLELSPGEKNYLNPGVAFFPNSMTSPQISPFSGSPFSTGTHTPSVFFSPSPLPYHQQFQRQSLPTQPSSPRPPLSELSVSALMCGQDMQGGLEQEQRGDGNTVRLFETFKPKPVESISEQPPPLTPEPENDTAPLLQTQKSKGPTICTTSMESTWPRRLIGRRRTVRQGGAVHNLPILPPLPSLLIRSVSDKKPMPRLSPFPEHQAKVEGKLGKSNLKSELKDCSLQDWKILRQMEEKKEELSKNEVVEVDLVECGSKMPPVPEKPEETSEENVLNPDCEVEVENENWEAVLEMVNSLWDEAWKDSDSQNLGSLRRWPLLHPPSGFGGSQAPSGTSSELGAEDLLELERLSREESIDSEFNDIMRSSSDLHLKGNSVVVTQPTGQIVTKTKAPKVPSLLDLDTEVQLGNKYGLTGSPDSNLTLDSDSSGVYMSNPSQTSKEDITSDGDRSVFELDIGSASSLNTSKGVNEQGTDRAMGTCTVQISNSRQSTVLKTDGEELSRERSIKEIKAKVTVIQEGSRSMNKGSVHHEVCNTVNTSTTDVPLPLSPSKHEVKKGSLLDPSDMDPFVATDSFVYLAVSVMPPPAQDIAPTPAAPEEPSPPTAIAKPCPYPDECDFLSTDSFVYLAAPDCHLLGTDGHSVYEDSNDSEDSGSRADFVIASTVGDSDWDSDLTDSEAEPGSNKPAWDHWEELEQDVLRGLFCEDQLESNAECHDNLAQQISGRCGELAAIVVPERAEVCSQHTQGGGLHSKVKTVS